MSGYTFYNNPILGGGPPVVTVTSWYRIVFSIAGIADTAEYGVGLGVVTAVAFQNYWEWLSYNEGLAAFDVTVYQHDNFGMYLNKKGEPLSMAKLSLNNNTRFEIPSFFTNVCIPYEVHTKTPAEGIHLYSFALRPEDVNPTGYSSFIKQSTNQKLTLKVVDELADGTTKYTLHSYVISYSILQFTPSIQYLTILS